MIVEKRMLIVPLALAASAVFGATAAPLARPGSPAGDRSAICGGHGMGPGSGPGMGGPGAGPGMGPGGHGGDMMSIHYLFAHRDQIHRAVTKISGGVRTTTESDDPDVVAQLREHVRAMYARLKDHRPINTHDPLFAALFKNADKIDVRVEDTPKGLTVTETSTDPEVVTLIRRHADVVSLFLANGMHEMMRSH
jgi:hypothetical protein